MGDLVVVIAGARLPCLLRKAEKEARDGYELVGSCFVDGIMYGEENINNPESFRLF